MRLDSPAAAVRAARLARRCDRVLELVDGRITGETKGSDLAPAC